ncbi:MAG: ATP-dependent exonuclease, partial [Paucimonas sp.]|nr:ATP-dependent exonuclease [Paucimonas sp.]
NPIFSPQTTESPHAGQVWRLPLISVNFSEKTDTPAEVVLRDPLTVACEENENTSRLEEGRLLAKALLAARCELSNSEEPLCWKDVMLLVRKRTHLAFYESALREAGIPLISDRRGGLLDSLEALDLIALLSFLVTPCNNLALAHVLKSPVFGASDDDLIRLAECQGADWWTRLQAMSNASPPLKHAQEFLTPWIRDAAHLPVHDLLDRILHTGELQKKYAQAAPVSSRAQVLGNIDAFVELALNLDAGRYPSLQKFIEELTRLQKMGQNDSPDEADVEASADAVRILTVHSAKGLEARVVALLDANHSDASTDTLGILCEWPQDAAAPTHFSAFADKSERGKARDRFFTQEKELAEQEDWNLLYVAATRAKELLIVSGVASGKADSGEEIIEGSWYARLLHAAEYRPDEQKGQVDSADTGEFELPLFHPPVVEQLAVNEPNYSSVEIDEGVALHALLERLTLNARWPVDVPDAGTIARWLDCRIPIAEAAGTYARNILSNPDLESFFRPGCYDRAYNELDVMTPDGLMRFDRMVVNGGEIWILDYKRRVGDNERAAYEQQLQRYRRAVLPLFPGHAVRMVLISGDGGLLEIAADA